MNVAVELQSSEPYLRLAHLHKSFGEFAALTDVSLDIQAGEFVSFLGPSGCGKTTLLRAIAGLDIQSSGGIRQAGRDISALPPAARDFGIVFQSYALFPNLTVRRNVAYGLHSRGKAHADIEPRVSELLDTVGLADQGHKYPSQLSGGQQQRVALARALAPAPGLLLLDEPLSALDAKVRAHLRQELKALQRRLGVTTIMVTHDQEEALSISDRVVVMHNGSVEQIGTPQDIYHAPASAFVADFIGSMNFIPATVSAPGRVRALGFEMCCASEGFAQGKQVTAAIRPEDVLTEDGGDNLLEAELGRIEFLGAYVRGHFAASALGTQVLKADFPAHRARDLRLSEGARIPLRLPPERIHVYPAAHGRSG